jgi:hypothetical protein
MSLVLGARGCVDRGAVPPILGMAWARLVRKAATCVGCGCQASVQSWIQSCAAMGSHAERTVQFPASVTATVSALLLLHVFVGLGRWGAGVACRIVRQGLVEVVWSAGVRVVL